MAPKALAAKALAAAVAAVVADSAVAASVSVVVATGLDKAAGGGGPLEADSVGKTRS